MYCRGEYGEEWHHQGTLDKKQNVFDDFIAAAEYLIEHKYTRSDKYVLMMMHCIDSAHSGTHHERLAMAMDDLQAGDLWRLERWLARCRLHQPTTGAVRCGDLPSRRAGYAALSQVHDRTLLVLGLWLCRQCRPLCVPHQVLAIAYRAKGNALPCDALDDSRSRWYDECDI